MNITDIDDKIIMRAREGYLLKETKEKNPKLTPELIADARKAFAAFLPKLVKNLPSPVDAPNGDDALEHFNAIAKKAASDPAFVEAGKEKEEKFGLYITSLTQARDAILTAEKQLESGAAGSVDALVDGTASVLGPYYGETKGNTIADPVGVSRDLAQYWEQRYFEDMDRLHILRPDVITRVSEYVPEIVAFVDQIIKNGFAYEAEGSVWFDVNKFEGSDGDGFRHQYAKLQPSSKGNWKLLDEGEGALTGTKGKRQPQDFALWKAKSKPGEPAWPSPWGEGRPGWHIECSVMASEILGKNIDIHSGGIDLMFPHHDNELAQSEAYHGNKQWINYFLHTGHLHIEGLKMSKSLKNFISIDDALRDYTARQLRLAFMLSPWSSRLDFKRDLIADTKAKEETIDNFFTNVKARLSETQAKGMNTDGKHHFESPEKQLLEDLSRAQLAFRAALCDSFNTQGAVQVLLDLIQKVNVYFSQRGREYNIEPVRVIAQWITRQLVMFGLGEGPLAANASAIGWGKAGDEGGSGDVSWAALNIRRKLTHSSRPSSTSTSARSLRSVTTCARSRSPVDRTRTFSSSVTSSATTTWSTSACSSTTGRAPTAVRCTSSSTPLSLSRLARRRLPPQPRRRRRRPPTPLPRSRSASPSSRRAARRLERCSSRPTSRTGCTPSGTRLAFRRTTLRARRWPRVRARSLPRSTSSRRSCTTPSRRGRPRAASRALGS